MHLAAWKTVLTMEAVKCGDVLDEFMNLLRTKLKLNPLFGTERSEGKTILIFPGVVCPFPLKN